MDVHRILKPYQIFSGIMEVLAGLFLLNRKTITLGLFIASGVFINVMLLNLSYDIPVKIFSMHLVLYCFFLMTYDAKRLLQFFVFNKMTPPNLSYDIHFEKPWMRITYITAKVVFIILAVGLPFIINGNTMTQVKLWRSSSLSSQEFMM